MLMLPADNVLPEDGNLYVVQAGIVQVRRACSAAGKAVRPAT